MSFTDEDLKYLKNNGVSYGQSHFNADILPVLIARLEAAEKALALYEEHYDPRHIFGLRDLFEAWRKVSGK